MVQNLMTEETVPIFVNDIDKLLTSNAPPVRRMAIAAMQKANAIDFTNKQQETIANLLQVLCDRDPSVMGAGLPFVHELLSNSNNSKIMLSKGSVSIIDELIFIILYANSSYINGSHTR